VCRYTRSRCSKPELALTSACQRADRRHSGRSPCSQVSAPGLRGSPTAAQYAAIVAAGRARRPAWRVPDPYAQAPEIKPSSAKPEGRYRILLPDADRQRMRPPASVARNGFASLD
jgi:hypothetical protein